MLGSLKRMSNSPSTPAIKTVVIVDDSAVQRQHAAALCGELGITVLQEATNGHEALQRLAALPALPDLLLIDLEMPTMDGAELISQLQQHGISVPIIVASSRERSLLESIQTLGTVLGLQMVAALQKPLRLEAFRAALQNYRGAERRHSATGSKLQVDEGALRAGIEQGQIVAYYHPKVDLRTGALVAVEALARWKHPTLGLVPPDQFIPLAERSDLIHALTMSVMRQALQQTAVWNAQGLPLSVAVNLSPRLLERASLLQEISDLQQTHGLRAEQVVLEITESYVVAELGVALGVLARLRLRGFGLSLDDYGTGFSSMQQLSRIPFTELKIDRSFVHGAHDKENLQIILRSALEMASKLGLSTVAEGIETMQDWRLLQKLGCTIAQGWMLAKPMPAHELMGWHKDYQPRMRELKVAAANSPARRSARR